MKWLITHVVVNPHIITTAKIIGTAAAPTLLKHAHVCRSSASFQEKSTIALKLIQLHVAHRENILWENYSGCYICALHTIECEINLMSLILSCTLYSPLRFVHYNLIIIITKLYMVRTMICYKYTCNALILL